MGRAGSRPANLDPSEITHQERKGPRLTPVRAIDGCADTRRPARPICLLSLLGTKPFQKFSKAKRELDQLSGVAGWRLHDLRRTCVSGMAWLGVAPHVADKILNHQTGTISGVAAVYQRHEFLAERRAALDVWGAHIDQVLAARAQERRIALRAVA